MQLVDYLSRIHFFHRLKTGYYLISQKGGEKK
nr:MAG TPA: hypothetical protein [Caudoviricetes sp.]